MSRLICAPMAAALILAAVGSASPAAAGHRYRAPAPVVEQDRWCLQGGPWGYPGRCEFATREQCLATAFGMSRLYCGLNPTYAFREWRGYGYR
jgi:hypothetical protein